VRRRQVQRARAPATGGGAARVRGRVRKRTAEPTRAAEQRGKSSGGRGPPPDMLFVEGLGQGDKKVRASSSRKKDIMVEGLGAVHGAVRGVRLGCRTKALRARYADTQGCAMELKAE
jgi:hypothetical protein